MINVGVLVLMNKSAQKYDATRPANDEFCILIDLRPFQTTDK